MSEDLQSGTEEQAARERVSKTALFDDLRVAVRTFAPRLVALGAGETAIPKEAIKFFPLAGLLIGLCAVPVLVAAVVTLPQPAPVILAYATVVGLTSANGERRLARLADLLAGEPRPSQETSLGAAGAMVLMLVLALKLSGLSGLDFRGCVGAIASGFAASKLVHVASALHTPLAGDAVASRRGTLAVAAALGLIPGPLLLTPTPWLYALGSAILAAIVAHILLRRAPADAASLRPWAVEQAFETAYYLGAAAAISGPG